MSDQVENAESIAIIGMAGRFPGARTVEQYWNNLCNGVESISDLSDEMLRRSGVEEALIADPKYVKRCGLCSDTDLFDAGFFGINAREAETMDPQHRVMLECAWEALEHAGYDVDRIDGLVGVYAGCGMNQYLINNLAGNPDLMKTVGDYQIMVGNGNDYLSTRISYKLNLRGPSVTVLTACSTSLVAIHTACQSLFTYQCDMALAGGVSLKIPHETGYLHKEGQILSPEGRCRAFDEKADGTVWSEGAGLVVLKRLSEAIESRDTVYAVIKSTAINNDGSAKVGYTAPSVEGQAQAIALAHALAEVEPRSISYIETHGTGTLLGDPIEIAGLQRVFSSDTPTEKYCAIGSVKTNIGHLDAAAGVAGIIKTALSLKHRTIPPSLHFTQPNPQCGLEKTPFFVNTTLRPWETTALPRRAGVSSFGIGGTNAHAILEEPPVNSDPEASRRTWHLLPLSTRSAESLDMATGNLADTLNQKKITDIADIAYTLQTGRKQFAHRCAIVCTDSHDAASAIAAGTGDRVATGTAPGNPADTVFMFSGQGAQYPGMTLELYEEEPVFREEFDRCCALASPLLGNDLKKIIFEAREDPAGEELISQTLYTQPALFTVEYSLARLLMEYGIQPAAMVGHSIGEYVAACISCVFSLEDALKIVVRRAQLMQQQPRGVMLSISAPLEHFKSGLSDETEISLINAPQLFVVGGPTGPMGVFETFLNDHDVRYRRLHTSHAFHTAMMDGACDEFVRFFGDISFGKPGIPFVSNVSGTWITDAQATSADYWASHIRSTVRFSDNINELLRSIGTPVFVELGPGTTLCTLAGLHTHSQKKVLTIPTIRHGKERMPDDQVFIRALGDLWVHGVSIDFDRMYPGEKRYRIGLPSYPFERERYWVDPPGKVIFSAKNSAVRAESSENINASVNVRKKQTLHARPHLSYEYIAPETATESTLVEIWQRFLGIGPIGRNDDFFDLGGHSLLAVQLFSDIQKETGVNLPLATLFSAPTLKVLAEKVDDVLQKQTPVAKNKTAGPAREENPWSYVVPIKPTGSRTPFFCVHGVGGNVLNYYQMNKFLDADQPLYGLQCRGLDGLSRPFASVKEMAAAYNAEIRQVQPHGPYILGGGSMGGLVAYEMALQLVEAGETVKNIIMFDSFCLKGYEPGTAPGEPVAENEPIPVQKKRSFAWKVVNGIKCRVRDGARMALCRLYHLRGEPIPHELRYWMIEQKNIVLSEQYVPRPYHGRITFFRATLNYDCTDPYRGWRGVAGDTMEFYDYPCPQETTIEQVELLKKLSDILTSG